MWIRSLLFLLGLAAVARGGLEWDDLDCKLHTVTGGTNLVARYTFRNAGTNAVTITSVKSSCSTCTTASADKKTYAPGEKGVVTAVFQVGAQTGVLDKTIAVSTTDAAQPVTTLQLRVSVGDLSKARFPEPPLRLKPAALEWKVGETKTPKTILIEVRGEAPIRVLGVKSDNPKLAAKLETLISGQSYGITVTPSATDKAMKGRLAVETDAPSGEKVVAVEMVVR